MESVAVGLIVDSSIVIVAERRGNTVTQVLEDWESVFGEVEIGISVITVLELTHGAR
jgi:predicted nucleic acid-binding protein